MIWKCVGCDLEIESAARPTIFWRTNECRSCWIEFHGGDDV